MSQRGIRLFGWLAAALALSACSVNVNAEKLVKREDRRFQVTGRPEVTLRTFDGAITVRSSDQPEVLVTIERQAGDKASLESIQVKADQQGNAITVEVVRPERNEGITIGTHVGRSASLIVTVPRDADVSARSGDGAISVEQVAGRLDVSTGDGAVTVRSTKGNLIVHTGDGGLSLDGVDGQVELTTGDGGVTINGMLKRLTARTGDGAISVRAASGSEAVEEWRLESGDGSIALELPRGFGAELDARSNDGGVTLDGFEIAGAGDRRERNELRGRIGQGGSRLTIRTGDGAISIRRS